LDALEVFQVVADDDTTFTARHQLARLKAEGAQVADRTCSLPAPHASMNMGAIFHDFQFVFLSDAHDRVKICKAHAEVDGENGTRFGSNGLFDQSGIDTI